MTLLNVRLNEIVGKFKKDKVGYGLYILGLIFGLALFSTLPIFTYREGFNLITNFLSIIFCTISLAFILLRGKFIFDAFICPLLILCFYSLISWMITRYSPLTARSMLTLYALLFFVYEFAINSESAIKFIYFLVAGSVFLFIFILIDNFDIFLTLDLERLGAEFGNLNTVGLSFSNGMLLIFFLGFRAQKIWQKIICFSFCLIFAAFMFLTESRGAIFVGLFSCLIFAFLKLKGKNRIIFLLLLIFSLVAFFAILSIPYFDSLRKRIIGIFITIFSGGMSTAGTANGRLFMIQEGIYLWLQSPLFGHGTDSFTYISDFAVYSHASISDVLCNQGLLGLFLWIFPMLYLCIKAKNSYSPLNFGFFVGLIIPSMFFYIITTSKIAMPVYVVLLALSREDTKISSFEFSFLGFKPRLLFRSRDDKRETTRIF